MFDADRPITKSTQDRLSRATFAKYLARCLLDHKDPDSFVIGLYGGWGVGKTSVINLMVEELNNAATNIVDTEKPIILNFSPWSYSGQNQLIYSFFRRLSSTLRTVPHLENRERIIHLLELYVSFFTRKPIPRSLRTKRSLWEKLTFQGREEVYAWESGRDLTVVKSELNELLRTQRHRIIIVIDNISRLYAYEIKQMFQIVKSMGDYCNTAYLLAFDKEQIVHTLNQLDGRGGSEFIEKIIQLPFEIPPIQQQDLEKILADRLSQVIKTVPANAWNNEYWADVYYNSLKYFFENCRDITRYVNTLNFSYPVLKEVVNPVDFFVLTALEVFAPDIYAAIIENKDLFTDLLDKVYVLNDEELKKEKLRIQEILKRNHRINEHVMLDLLIRLFPRLRKIFMPDVPFYYSDSLARKNKRVCSPDLFDIYFRLSMQVNSIPKTEFKTLLALADDVDSFHQALARLNQDGRIVSFLDLLDSKTLNTLPEKNIPTIIFSLLDNGDFFPSGTNGPLNLDTPTRIHHIIHLLLQRIPDTETRFTLLQDTIAKLTKSIYTIIHELQEQSREHESEDEAFVPLEYRDLTPEELSSLQQLTISRISIWAENGSLESHPKLLAILFAWADWQKNDACNQYVTKLTNTDRGLVSFLQAVLSSAIDQACEEYVKEPGWEKFIEDINTFIDPQKLVPHARKLFEDEYFEKLREREQLALMIFLDLMHAPTKKIIPKTSV